MQAWRPWTPPTQGFRRGPCHPRARPSSLAIVGGGLAPRCPGQAPEALSYNTTQSPEPHSVITYHTMRFASLCCVIRAPVFWGEFASGVSIQACPRKRPKRHPRPASDGLPEGPRPPLPNQAQEKPAKTRKRPQREAHEANWTVCEVTPSRRAGAEAGGGGMRVETQGPLLADEDYDLPRVYVA